MLTCVCTRCKEVPEDPLMQRTTAPAWRGQDEGSGKWAEWAQEKVSGPCQSGFLYSVAFRCLCSYKSEGSGSLAVWSKWLAA